MDILTLALAKRGGGSSVQPNYSQNDSSAADFIKNRPFYDEEGMVTKTLLDHVDMQKFISAMESGENYVPDGFMEAGKEYTLTIDGVSKKYVAQQVEESEGVFVTYIGDNITELNNGASPIHGFVYVDSEVIGFASFEIIDESLLFSTPLRDDNGMLISKVTLTTEELGTVTHKMSGRFIEDGYYSDIGVGQTLLDTDGTGEPSSIEGIKAGCKDFWVGVPSGFVGNLSNQTVLQITIDNDSYICSPKQYNVDNYGGGGGFGNLGIISDTLVDTGEPFFMTVGGPWSLIFHVVTDKSTVHFKIKTVNEIVHKIDPKYLPSGAVGGGLPILELETPIDVANQTTLTEEETAQVSKLLETEKYIILSFRSALNGEVGGWYSNCIARRQSSEDGTIVYFAIYGNGGVFVTAVDGIGMAGFAE